MKPDWDRLMGDFDGSDGKLVADVDCTAAGKPLCDSNGVQGFPTIKYGDPSNLEKYEGGRDYNALKKFADENLKPVCSPASLELCDAEQKAVIDKYMAMSDAELDAAIKDGDDKISAAEATFKAELDKLQALHKTLTSNKDNQIAAVKASGLSAMKSVKAWAGSSKCSVKEQAECSEKEKTFIEKN